MPKIYESLFSSQMRQVSKICDPSTKETIKLSEILKLFPANGNLFLTSIISTPILFPISVPGIATIIGIVIFLLGLSVSFNAPPFIPKRFLNRELQSKRVSKFFSILSELSRLAEGLFRPRLIKFAHSKLTLALSGGIISICGLLILLPLPPFANIPPALLVVLLAISHIESDGLAVICVYCSTVVGAFFFIRVIGKAIEYFATLI